MTRAGSVYRGRWGVGMNAEGMERAGVVAATAHCELAGLQRVDKRLRRLPCVPDGRRPRAHLTCGRTSTDAADSRTLFRSVYATRRAWAAIPAHINTEA